MQARYGMAVDDIERIERTLFFEQPQLRERLTRFTMLILFASIIATGGLLGDSVASVIGAMIVAPLMTPIMGIVVALVIGSTARALRTNFTAILFAGTLTFVCTGLAAGVGRKPSELRSAAIGLALLVVAVSIPLTVNSRHLWSVVHHEDDALAIVRDWLDQTDWEIYEVRVDGDDVELVLMGDGDLPNTDAVVADLREELGDEMDLTARILGVRKEVISTTDETEMD